jgi:NAD(P)-dependent dehydrogenase (short-subunit alcohol dehydrogenase family)
MSFEQKTVAITGAAGNLGRAVAAAFAGHGAKLILLDVRQDSLESAYPGNDSAKLKLAVDLLDAQAVTSAIAEAEAQTGGIDVLCAIAGGFHMGEPVHQIPAANWQLMLDMNAGTLLNTVQAVVPGMLKRKYGKIITIGANAAHRGMADMGAYCAGKSAVMRLTESLSAELRGHGINVNGVLPSIIDTPENRAAMPKADPGKWVAPEQLAAVILFLASDAAAAVHGALIPVTGLS